MDQNNVYKRPNPSDSDADLIKFQNLFLAEKSKNSNFQPAAKVVRLTNPGNEYQKKKNRTTQLYFILMFQKHQLHRKFHNLPRNEVYRKSNLRYTVKIQPS